MNDERVVQKYEPNKEQMAANLAEILLDTGRYNYASREAPEGYTTIRDSFRWADVHPSWLRTMLADGKFSQFDEDGLPAVLKNPRGAWAVRIDALQAYASGMRSIEPSGEPGAPVYKYEPMELKCCKRAVSSAKARGLSEQTVEELQGLVDELNKLWHDGKIGKKSPEEAEAEAKEAKANKSDEREPDAPAADADDTDFEFDFEDES